MTSRGASSLCTAFVLLAGCIAASPASEETPTVLPEPETDETTGAIDGLVTDDSLVPVANALVGILERDVQTTTDAEGRFVLSRLEPGTVVLAVNALGLDAHAGRITVTAGEVTNVNVQLTAIPIVEPYHVTQEKKGRIFCGTHLRPVVAFAACGAVYGTPLSGLDSFVVPFDLASNNISFVHTMIFETAWTPTQVFGSGLNVRWETFTNITPAYTFTEPVRVFAITIGKSPLWASVDQDTIRGNVTKHKPPPSMCQPNGPCKFWARVFPYANTLGPSYPADFAFYVDQGYTHYASEFYGEAPPEKWTALADQ